MQEFLQGRREGGNYLSSTKELLHQINSPNLSRDDEARLRCQLAGQFEEEGNYEAAREIMGDLWSRVGERPKLEGLANRTKAAVLLRAGTLTRDIGSVGQVEGAQEIAKDLITESISLYEALQVTEGVAEGQIEIAVCYRREGAFDEARVMLRDALAKLDDDHDELKTVGLLRSVIIEESSRRYHDALRIHTAAAPLFERSANAVLKGKFHHLYGFVLRKLGGGEQRQDYIDQALIEYAAASFYFEEAGLSRHQACVENNLGFLFGTIGRFNKSHEHLDRAQALFTTLKDKVHLAQVDETRARTMLAEGRVGDALNLVAMAIHALEKGGEQSLLAEALTTQGTALARLGQFELARTALQRALDTAHQAGDLESAGHAALVMVEELDSCLSNNDLRAAIDLAQDSLTKTQDMSTLRRLASCACRVVSLAHASTRFPASIDWTNFSIEGDLLLEEAHFVKLALRDSGGSVTQAARLLGLPSHQTLLWMLNTRHKNLLTDRKPIIPRRRSVIQQIDPGGGSKKKASRKARTAKILHVEDDSAIASMMKETLAHDGLDVEICEDGEAAMKKIASHAHYDLFLLDYELAGANGVQLVQQARSLAHRQQTPIIILSATLDEETARLAGADAFLHKPEGVIAVSKTVSRLLEQARD